MLILIYVSICYVIFKIFKIRVNQWSLATSALGGIIGIALLLLIVNYNHLFTTNARIYFSAPVLHSVRGRVTEVPVQANVPLKEGDALFHALAAAFQPKSLQRVKTATRPSRLRRRARSRLQGQGPRRPRCDCGRSDPGDGRPRSFAARTEGAAQMGNEKEGGEGSLRKKSSYEEAP